MDAIRPEIGFMAAAAGKGSGGRMDAAVARGKPEAPDRPGGAALDSRARRAKTAHLGAGHPEPRRRMIRRWLSAALAGGLITAAPPAVAQRLTVLDYFRLVDVFEDPAVTHDWMIDPRNGGVVDIPNGYLYAAGDGAQEPVWICVFRDRAGEQVIGVKMESADDQAYTTRLSFHRYRDGRLVEVTALVLPEPVNADWRYEMPRYGTTIHVRDRAGRPLHDLAWNRERFVHRAPEMRR
jgi:hypothetical protein